jgi:hypothetical protein
MMEEDKNKVYCSDCEEETDSDGDPVGENCDCSYGPSCDTCGHRWCDQSC